MLCIPAMAGAHDAIIVQRSELLKALGRAGKLPGEMMRGDARFDLAKVQSALKAYAEFTPMLVPLFPGSTQSARGTKALPAIWERKQEFDAMWDRLLEAAAAASVAIKDEASFKTEWPKVAMTCSGCHRQFKER